ncbi:MAG TPA: hypothetical protein VE033_08275 [Acetobacteraceae bacterium]|nr:hypothetical protein [Acetobacteraceae bacterium]
MLRWPLPERDADSLHDDPRVKLDATMPPAWEPLRGSSARILAWIDFDAQDHGPRRCVLRIFHGRHPFHRENARRARALRLRMPGTRPEAEQVDEAQHAQMIGDLACHARLVEGTFAAREAG